MLFVSMYRKIVIGQISIIIPTSMRDLNTSFECFYGIPPPIPYAKNSIYFFTDGNKIGLKMPEISLSAALKLLFLEGAHYRSPG